MMKFFIVFTFSVSIVFTVSVGSGDEDGFFFFFSNCIVQNYEESESGLVVIETLFLGLDEYQRMVMEDEGEGRRG